MGRNVKRKAVIVGVVVIHVVLLAWIVSLLMHSRKSEGPGPAAATAGGAPPTQLAAAGLPVGGAAAVRPAGPPDAGTPAGAAAAAPAAVPPAPVAAVPLPQIAFTNGTATVPANLNVQTQGCKAGILIDWTNKKILWNKSADTQVPIASMTKMMTALLLMERIHSDPSVTLQTQVKVTKTASLVGGSQVYLDPRETFTLDELLKCMMIFSANDVTHLIAEFLGGGSADAFVAQMNKRAQELGLTHTHFVTPHGLPLPGQKTVDQSSPRELAYLAGMLLNSPEVVKWSSTRTTAIREHSTQFKPFQLVSRNGLVGRTEGLNGMKTGYTKEAGFCMAATCVRGGRTLICVVNGCSKSEIRNNLVENLLNWGYAQ